MKERVLVRFFCITGIILLLSGCIKNVPDKTGSTSSNTTTTTPTTEVVAIESTPDMPEQDAINEFSLLVGTKYISLKDWDYEADIQNVLGEPLKETQEVLGSGADTHAGSIIKTQEYEGLSLKLFSPKQNGKEFWVLQMFVNSDRYKTYREITVGTDINQLKQAYPETTIKLDGRTDPNNCAYVFNLGNMDGRYIRFEVADGIIKEIDFYFKIP